MLEYQRDLPADSPPAVVEAEKEHVRAHLAAVADADDDPTTRVEDVRVWVARHPEDRSMIRIEGVLDADADAPYLKDDFDPFAGTDPALLRESGLSG